MRILLLFFCLQLLSNLLLIAQQNPEDDKYGISTVIPPSPTSSSLGRYGEYEVDMASGVSNISIPLYEVKSGQLSLPITLSYHAGGNKVNEVGSWVGMGWSLNCGGVITRTMNGKPDESGNGFVNNAAWLKTKTTFVDSEYNTLLGLAGGVGDSEPDFFNFNFNGNSGKFLLNELGQPICIPYSPIDFKFQNNEFTATLPDGTKYLFTARENTTFSTHTSTITYTSSWYLTSITSVDGFDQITIYYNSHPLNSLMETSKAKHYEANNIGGAPSQLTPPNDFSSVDVQALKPTSIQFGLGHLDFIWLNNGNNGPGEIKLTEILVKDNNGIVKSDIEFDITLFNSYGDCSLDKCKRNKLRKVAIDDRIYQFNYDETPLPPIDSNNKDHWGFYNGASNSSPLPSFVFRGVNIGGGAIRTANEIFMQAGILKSIVYPTGGSTQFEYEANKYYYYKDEPDRVEFDATETFTLNHNFTNGTWSLEQDTWPKPFLIEGIPVGEPYYWYDKVDMHVQFGSVWQLDTDINSPTYNQKIPKPYTHEPTVTFDPPGSGITINVNDDGCNYIYDPNVDLMICNKYLLVTVDPNTTNHSHNVQLLTSSDNRNYVTMTLDRKGYYEEMDPNGGHMVVGGLRIKSIKNFDYDGKFINAKDFNYNDSLNHSTAYFTIGQYSNYKGLDLYVDEYIIDPEIECGLGPQVGHAYIGDNLWHTIISDNYKTGFGLGAAPVAYSIVTERNVNEQGNDLGKTVNYFTTTTDQQFLQYPYSPRVDKSWQRSQLKHKQYFENNNGLDVLKKAEFNYYSLAPNTQYIKGAKISFRREYTCFVRPDVVDASGSPMARVEYEVVNARFHWNFYEFNSSSYRLDSTKVFTYENGVANYTTSYFQYAANVAFQSFLKQKKDVLGSEMIIEDYIYPFDFQYPLSGSSDYLSINSMLPLGVISPVLEKRVSRSSSGSPLKTVSSILTLYNGNSPIEYYGWEGVAPVTDFQKFENLNGKDSRYSTAERKISYSNGRVQQIAKKSGLMKQFIWGYNNQLPVAEIVTNISNITLAPSFYESFEWIAHVAIVENVLNAKTGKRYFEGDYSLTFNPPTPNNFILSYWYFDIEWKLKTEVYTGPKVLSDGTRIDEVRVYPKNSALMTTYSYEPLIGIISVTDPNSNSTYYEYDLFNRLKLVRDNNRNITNNYQYNYKE